MKRPSIGKLTLFIAAGLFALWLAGLVYFVSFVITATPELANERTDAIIVLTGGRNRVNTGLTLFAEGKSPYLLISGVNPGVSLDNIRAMHVDPPPLPECCIVAGYRATNTRANATESENWIKGNNFTSIRLITSDYHIPRAMTEFRHLMPQLKIIRHPIKEYPLRSYRFWSTAFGEYHKTLLTWIWHRAGLGKAR